MKTIFAFLFFFLIPLSVFGQASAPKEAVWVTPADAKVGDAVELNTLVYNSEKQEITFTVVFSTTEPIATTTVVIPAQSAKVATGKWIMPKESTQVTASVTKALTKLKKDITALHGPLGTITVGQAVRSIPGKEAASAWIGRQLSLLELYRLKQAERYAALRDQLKEEIGMTKPSQIIKDMLPESPTPVSEEEPKLEENSNPLGNAYQYALYIYRSALAALFENKAVFYISLGIVVLLVIRFIFSRFI
jgi:hypothetical protein